MIDTAILPAENVLSNRQKKRRFVFEAERIVPHLEEINQEFLYRLFDEEDKTPYSTLYEEYHVKWCNKVEWILDTMKVKYVLINLAFFSNQYKPKYVL